MSGIIFSVSISCLLIIALTLFSFGVVVNDLDLILILDGLIIYLIICYVYCYYSENITTTSLKIGDVVYDSLWYEMPIKEQRAIILMIQRSQKEFRLSGLGLVDCSLATFLSVNINFLLLPFNLKYLLFNNFFRLLRLRIPFIWFSVNFEGNRFYQSTIIQLTFE